MPKNSRCPQPGSWIPDLYTSSCITGYCCVPRTLNSLSRRAHAIQTNKDWRRNFYLAHNIAFELKTKQVTQKMIFVFIVFYKFNDILHLKARNRLPVYIYSNVSYVFPYASSLTWLLWRLFFFSSAGRHQKPSSIYRSTNNLSTYRLELTLSICDACLIYNSLPRGKPRHKTLQI